MGIYQTSEYKNTIENCDNSNTNKNTIIIGSSCKTYSRKIENQNEELTHCDRKKRRKMENGTIMQYGPYTVENFIRIYNDVITNYYENIESEKHWLFGMCKTYSDFKNLVPVCDYNLFQSTANNTMLRIEDNPLGEDIDCIWALYFATKNVDYANIVKTIGMRQKTGNIIIDAVTDASAWSYTSLSPFPNQK